MATKTKTNKTQTKTKTKTKTPAVMPIDSLARVVGYARQHAYVDACVMVYEGVDKCPALANIAQATDGTVSYSAFRDLCDWLYVGVKGGAPNPTEAMYFCRRSTCVFALSGLVKTTTGTGGTFRVLPLFFGGVDSVGAYIADWHNGLYADGTTCENCNANTQEVR